MIRTFYAACALILSTGLASAQTPPGDPDIIVQGERLREVARAWVEDVAVAPRVENQLARWDRRICPRVTGLPLRQAGRITRAAPVRSLPPI